MPKYHRVLVKYPLLNSKKWSDFHWCDIEKIANDIVIKTAPVGGVMPSEAEFRQLPSEAMNKLLVCDFEQTDPYCLLVFKDKVMYQFNFQKFNFQKSIPTLPAGRAWSFESDDFDGNRKTLRAKIVFEGDEILKDNRTYYETLQSVSNLYDHLKSQYSHWKEQDEIKNGTLIDNQLEAGNIKKDNSTTTDDIRRPDESKKDILIDDECNINVQRALLASCKNDNTNKLQPTNYLSFFATLRNIDYSTLILKLLGVAACTYALFVIGTSPWIGAGLIVVGALCLCAGMIGNPYCTKLPNLFNCAR